MDREPPDLQQLKRLVIFATVVEQGSFAQAAQRLAMSRSAVSEQVALLEQALQVRLLQRTTRQLTLTLEGEQIYPEAAQINKAFQAIKQGVTKERVQGRIRITTSLDLALDWLHPRLQAFHALYPAISFDVVAADSELDLVAEQIDVALRIGPLRDASLVVRPLFQYTLQIVASPAYLQALAGPLTYTALAQQTWILLKQVHPQHEVSVFHHEHSIGFQPAQFHRCDSPLIAKDLIKRGLGIGLLLPATIEKELREGSLQLVLPQWQGETFTFSIVYPSRRHLPLRVRLLVDYLLAEAGSPDLPI